MRTLLDTSVLVALRDGDVEIKRRAAALDTIALISAISIVELEGGIVGSPPDRAKRRAATDAIYTSLDVIPFRGQEAAAYGQIVAALGFSRPKVIDRMIAAQALVAQAKVATLNFRDFSSIPSLVVERWSD